MSKRKTNFRAIRARRANALARAELRGDSVPHEAAAGGDVGDGEKPGCGN
jgi:hypothetical protein